MENASKALIMAGEVLLSIIVVSLLMIMFNSLFSYQQLENQNKKEAQVIQFNNQFEGYKRDRVRGNELISLVNKVTDYNIRESVVGTDNTGIDYGYQNMTVVIKFKSKTNRKKLTRLDSNLLFTTDTYTFNSANGRVEASFKTYIDNLKNSKLKTPNLSSDSQRDKQKDSNKNLKEFRFTEDKINNLLDSYDKIFSYIDLDQDKFAELDNKFKFGIFEEFNNAFGEEYFLIYKTVNNKPELLSDGELWNLQKDYLIKPTTTISKLDKNTKFDDLSIWERLNIYSEYAQFKKGVFKCTNVKYDENTGRIIKMEFEFTGKFD